MNQIHLPTDAVLPLSQDKSPNRKDNQVNPLIAGCEALRRKFLHDSRYCGADSRSVIVGMQEVRIWPETTSSKMSR